MPHRERQDSTSSRSGPWISIIHITWETEIAFSRDPRWRAALKCGAQKRPNLPKSKVSTGGKRCVSLCPFPPTPKISTEHKINDLKFSPCYLTNPDTGWRLTVNLISAVSHSAPNEAAHVFQVHFPGPGMDVHEPQRLLQGTQLQYPRTCLPLWPPCKVGQETHK